MPAPVPASLLVAGDSGDRLCPWSNFDPGTISFCERRLCAWIAEPSNAWSSVAYVVVALLLVLQLVLQRTRTSRGRILALAAAQLLIGVGSFFFHASGTFVGEVVDQVGMFMLSALILCFSAAQARGWSDRLTVAVYVAVVVASTALLLVVRPIGIPLFAVQLAVGLSWQIALFRRSTGEARAAHQPFFIGLGIFLTALGIWVTDITGVLCNPDHHVVTGHAVWHVLNASCGLWLGRFYVRRFAALEA